MKKLVQIIRDVPQHWVGDGFPVRTLFSYSDGNRYDPFLLLDYAGPYEFAPGESKRGVGEHPHRGFETVTIIYQGEVEHRDSSGSAGSIGPGDVQWMTAASGVVHEEFHSQNFSKNGGMFEVIQLWVNLPSDVKMSKPKYQELRDQQFPRVELPDDAGTVRVIAGSFRETPGPAETFTPINLWDVQLRKSASVQLEIPEGQTTLVVLQSGQVSVNGNELNPGELAQLDRQTGALELSAKEDSRMLVLTGEPIEEPVVGHGPFVMNTREEIQQAIVDYQSGKMGHLS